MLGTLTAMVWISQPASLCRMRIYNTDKFMTLCQFLDAVAELYQITVRKTGQVCLRLQLVQNNGSFLRPRDN